MRQPIVYIVHSRDKWYWNIVGSWIHFLEALIHLLSFGFLGSSMHLEYLFWRIGKRPEDKKCG